MSYHIIDILTTNVADPRRLAIAAGHGHLDTRTLGWPLIQQSGKALNSCFIRGVVGTIGGFLVETLASAERNVRAVACCSLSGFRGALDRLDSQVLKSVEVTCGLARNSARVSSVTLGRNTTYHLAVPT